MIGLLQRVTHASVIINGDKTASIGTGILVLVGIEKTDTQAQAERLMDKLIAYRVFPDTKNKMNLSLQDINGGLLLVPQFTLPADTRKGMRPSFSNAAPPEQGKDLFEHLLRYGQKNYPTIEAGRFGADMQINLTNDGPVTFWLQV